MERTMRSIETDVESADTKKAGNAARTSGRSNAGRFQSGGFSLPPPRPARWVPHRKAEVVAAVQGGYLSIGQACQRYDLSVEEYLIWQRGVTLLGLAGLRVNSAGDIRRGRFGSRDCVAEESQISGEDGNG
jgi:hypothetical protein